MPTTPVITRPPAGTSNGSHFRPSRPSPGRPPDRSGRDGLLIVLYALAAVALIASLVAVGLGLRAVDEAKGTETDGAVAGAGAAAAPMAVTLTEMAITPATLEVAEGGTLDVTNGGSVARLAVDGESLMTPMLDPGGTSRLDLAGLEAGSYTVYCEVTGHRAAGMEATLAVAAAGTASGAAAAEGATTPPHP